MTTTHAPKNDLEQSAETPTYDVIVVGGGFGGIYQLRHLRDRGFSVILLEASGGFGGAWSLNRYPGARVDSHAQVYQFTDEYLWQDWDFSQRFPDHEEMRSYFNYVDSKLDLSKDSRFNTKVVSATFDEEQRMWTLEAQDGAAFRARFVVFATGSTTEPYIPSIPDMDAYQGELVHTARWRSDLDMAGKRVAIIGTGASAVQVVQEAGPVVDHLTVFQRTPNLSLPMQQKYFDDEEQAAIKKTMPDVAAKSRETHAAIDYDFDPRSGVETPEAERNAVFERLWNQGGFAFWLGNFSDYLFNEKTNALAYEFWKNKIKPQIKDPLKSELLAPEVAPHPFGAKRPALHQNYYEVMNQTNVSLVSSKETPIVGFTETGIRTADGAEHGEFDIIVLATGFDNNTGALTSIDVRNANGVTLRDKWSQGVDAYLGAVTAGFPNAIFVYGPQSPAAFGNGSTNAERQGEVMIELFEYLRSNGLTRFESTVDADKAWTKHINETDAKAIFHGTKSWYNGGNIPGKKMQMLQYLNGYPTYMGFWQAEKESGYTDGLTVS
ncbi:MULTISPECIES: flavin-containing monooxygenase [Rhodococcus]|uniref:flavin-containing monooxygenase n=1 Tax=Rhodococcus TaxID=1827 RepID=UPI000717EDF3|nr:MULTISPECIES: NAD(P)/FAD-dependent oxidoreductase [Rhodococcus]MBW0292598.1 cyclopentanone 1,2-monooxygenase [Rhodococcus sp. MH15]MCZ4618363.1 NAD(P)/FAD-dependent oxidoreductase [Rhodococcus qingshengii]MEA1798644.1 NAD(P)/FAD-dependent oxidoreductase [Rhodococcus qingshengii]